MADASFWLDALDLINRDAEGLTERMFRAREVLGEMQDEVMGDLEETFRKLQAAQEEVCRQRESAERGLDRISAKIREAQSKIKAVPAGQDKEQERKKIISENQKQEREIARCEKLSRKVTEIMRQLGRVSEEIERALSNCDRIRGTQLTQMERSGERLHEAIRDVQNFAYGVNVACERAERLASVTERPMCGYGLKSAFQIVPRKRSRGSGRAGSFSASVVRGGRAVDDTGERSDTAPLTKDTINVFVAESANKRVFLEELDALSGVEQVKISTFRFGKFGGGKLFPEMEARGYRLVRNESGGYIGSDGMVSWEKS